jgi:hypothetical protein
MVASEAANKNQGMISMLIVCLHWQAPPSLNLLPRRLLLRPFQILRARLPYGQIDFVKAAPSPKALDLSQSGNIVI